MPDILSPDLCVIGAGSGGLSVAAAAAAFGVPVVLIERGEMGGDCLNAGCVPSKALLAAGKAAHAFRKADRYGLRAAEPVVDMAAVRTHVRGVIATIAPHDSEERFTGLGVRVIRAQGRFTAPDTVAAGEHTIQARQFVVATGSRAAIPPIPGLGDGPYLTNESVFDLAELPGHLAILGGGPIGCEMAQAFRRLGAQVTVIEAVRPLARDDAEAAEVVVNALRAEGVQFRVGASVTRVAHAPGSVTLTLTGPDGSETVQATHLLVAAGRAPVTDGLDLEAGGIEYGKAGIVTDKALRSVSNRRVYAVGDIAGRGQFTHLAGYHAGLVVRNALFRLPVAVDPAAIPAVTYTEPELGRAGLTEAEAREKHGEIRVVRAEFHGNDRAVTERATEGFVKLIATRRGRLVGAVVVGHGASDLTGTLQLAVSRKLPLSALAGVVAPYPTRGEAIKRAAVSYFAPFSQASWVRQTVKLLRRLG